MEKRTHIHGWLVSLFASAAILIPCQAVATDSLREIRQLASDIVREIDPSAQIKVSVTRRNTPEQLRAPGTPFTLESVTISSHNNSPEFESLEITIFSSLRNISQDTQRLVRDVLSGYASEVRLSTQPLPRELVEARRQAGVVSDGVENNRQWEAPLSDVLTHAARFLSIGEGSFSRIDKFSLNAKRIATIVVALCIVIWVLLVVLWMRVQSKTLVTIENGLRSICSALESTGMGGSSAEKPLTAPRDHLSGASLGEQSRNLATMPEDGLLALIADCYWSEQDHYGSFLWRRIPVDRKLRLIERLPQLADYGRFLSGVEEEDLGTEQDPCYLQPIPLWNLDMQIVTDIVRENHLFISALSPLRLLGLRLKPTEKFAIYQEIVGKTLQTMPVLPDVKSAARLFKQTIPIRIQSDEEEMEVLRLNDPSLELIEQVPSLGWLLFLPPERIEAILQPISARDLASAWIGHASILERLGPFVGDKKLELMQSYRSRLTASREAGSFLRIHSQTLIELRKQQRGTEKVAGHAA